MSSSVVKSHDWPSWIMWATGYQIKYYGSASMTVARANGSSTATVSLTASFCAPNGDDASWYMALRTKNGSSGTWSSWTYQKFEEESYSPKHPAGGYKYGATISLTPTVDTSEGTLYTEAYMYVDGFTSYSGGSSSVWSESFSYASKGCSIITSATTLNITDEDVAASSTVRITNYLNTSDISRYLIHVYNLDYSSSNYIYSNTISGAQTQFTYTLDTASTSYGQKAILNACKTSTKPRLRIRLETYTSDGSVGVSWFDTTGTISQSASKVTSNLTVDYTLKCSNVPLSGSQPIVSGTITAGGIGATITGYYFTIVNASNQEVYRSSTKTVSSSSTITISSTTLDYVLGGSGYTIKTMGIDSRGYTTASSTSATIVEYTAPIPKIKIYCNGNNVEWDLSWTTTSINNVNDPYFTVYAKQVSTGTVTYFDPLDPETVQSSAVWTRILNAELTDPGYIGSHTFTDDTQLEDVDIQTYQFYIEMYDSVTGSSTTVVATVSNGILCMSALRGGNGVRFFGEAQASDAGTVTVLGRQGASGFRYYDPKDNNKFVDLWLSDTNSTSTVQRGLYDASYDTVSSTGAGWWCYLSDAGNININNTANASTRGIYLNSHNIYGRVGSTDKRIADWVNTDSTVSGWRVRKTALGLWDCYKDISVTGTISTAWGNAYRLQLGSTTWPATVSSTSQILSCTLTRVDSNDAWCWVCEETGATTSRTPIWELLRPNSSSTSYTYTYRIHAVLDFSGNEEEE